MKALSPGCVSKILKYAVNKERNKGEFIPEDLNLMRVKLVLQFKIMPILGCNAWNVLLRFITTGFFYKTMLCNPNNNVFGLISALSPTAVSPTQDVTQIKGQKCFLDNNYCDKWPTKTEEPSANVTKRQHDRAVWRASQRLFLTFALLFHNCETNSCLLIAVSEKLILSLSPPFISVQMFFSL